MDELRPIHPASSARRSCRAELVSVTLDLDRFIQTARAGVLQGVLGGLQPPFDLPALEGLAGVGGSPFSHVNDVLEARRRRLGPPALHALSGGGREWKALGVGVRPLEEAGTAGAEEDRAATLIQARARGFLERSTSKWARGIADLQAGWGRRVLAAAFGEWREVRVVRKGLRSAVHTLRLRHGSFAAHRHVGASFDGAAIFSREGKAVMADEWRKWRWQAWALTRWKYFFLASSLGKLRRAEEEEEEEEEKQGGQLGGGRTGAAEGGAGGQEGNSQEAVAGTGERPRGSPTTRSEASSEGPGSRLDLSDALSDTTVELSPAPLGAEEGVVPEDLAPVLLHPLPASPGERPGGFWLGADESGGGGLCEEERVVSEVLAGFVRELETEPEGSGFSLV